MWEADSILKHWELPSFILSCLSLYVAGMYVEYVACGKGLLMDSLPWMSGTSGCDFTTAPRLSAGILGVQHADPFLASLMGRYNLLFFASGGGKFNYQGTKRWLEDNLDHTGE